MLGGGVFGGGGGEVLRFVQVMPSYVRIAMIPSLRTALWIEDWLCLYRGVGG